MSLNVEIDPDLRFDSQILAELLVHWQNLCAGRRMPAKEDIDPLQLPPRLWPYLELVDVLRGETIRLRWRLIGTHVTTAVERDSTGAFFDELYGPDDFETLVMPFNWVIDNGKPVRLFGSSGFVGKDWNLYEGIYMPLAEDGATVDRVLGGVQYTLYQSR
jgi:hypothetical protein